MVVDIDSAIFCLRKWRSRVVVSAELACGAGTWPAAPLIRMTNNCGKVFDAASQVVRGARLRRARKALNRREAQGKKSVAEGARKKLTVFLTYTAPLPASDMSDKW